MGILSFLGKSKTAPAEKEEDTAPKTDSVEERTAFSCFILLEDATWDVDSLLASLWEQWE